MLGRFPKELIEEFTSKGHWGTMNYIDHLKTHVHERPEAEAIIDANRRVTFREFGKIVNRLAEQFRNLGINEGDVVGIQLPNVAEFHFVRYALSAIGAVTMPIGIVYRQAELMHVLGSTKAVGIVIPQEFSGFDYGRMVKELSHNLPALKHIIMTGKKVPQGMISLEALMEQDVEEEYPYSYLDSSRSDPNEVDLLLLTSGTTGLPKIVMVTPNAWLWTATVTAQAYGATSNDIIFPLPPITGGAGYNNCVGVPIVSGAKVILQERFDPLKAFELIEKEKVTLMAGIPTHAIKMMEAPGFSKERVKSLRVWLSVGAYLPGTTARLLEERFGCHVVNLFGCVEATFSTVTDIKDLSEDRYNSVGKCVKGAQVRLIDEHGREVPVGEIGELVVKNPGLALAYCNDPEGTKRVFKPDGWVHTGDYARFNENQYLRIEGRKKDIISRGGMKISAEEIEDLIRTHPNVVDVAIVGMPDPVLGEKTCAYILLREGKSVSLEEINTFLREKNIAKFKLPERLEVVPDFPYSSGYKVQKNVLREDIKRKLEQESKS